MGPPSAKLLGDPLVASRLEAQFADLDAEAFLHFCVTTLFAGRIALVSSFGADAVALLHMLSRVDAATPTLFIDTERHFPETLAYRDALVATLGLTNVRSFRPDPEEARRRDPEDFLWASDPDSCCDLRKVRPLAQALAPYDAWISGRKRFQAATRSAMPRFEGDGERVKINPLADWEAKDVENYLRANDLPRHPLTARGYPSIGCLPCTTPAQPGEDPRSGRWRGKGKTECGIHLKQPTVPVR